MGRGGPAGQRQQSERRGREARGRPDQDRESLCAGHPDRAGVGGLWQPGLFGRAHRGTECRLHVKRVAACDVVRRARRDLDGDRHADRRLWTPGGGSPLLQRDYGQGSRDLARASDGRYSADRDAWRAGRHDQALRQANAGGRRQLWARRDRGGDEGAGRHHRQGRRRSVPHGPGWPGRWRTTRTYIARASRA